MLNHLGLDMPSTLNCNLQHQVATLSTWKALSSFPSSRASLSRDLEKAWPTVEEEESSACRVNLKYSMTMAQAPSAMMNSRRQSKTLGSRSKMLTLVVSSNQWILMEMEKLISMNSYELLWVRWTLLDKILLREPSRRLMSIRMEKFQLMSSNRNTALLSTQMWEQGKDWRKRCWWNSWKHSNSIIIIKQRDGKMIRSAWMNSSNTITTSLAIFPMTLTLI